MSKKGIPHKHRSKEFKLRQVQEVLKGRSTKEVGREQGVRDSLVRAWVKQYREHGEAGLEPKRRPGNPLSKYSKCKELSEVEELRYELAKAELELSKLKKAYGLEGGCSPEKH